jgi:hypothetical protein
MLMKTIAKAVLKAIGIKQRPPCSGHYWIIYQQL